MAKNKAVDAARDMAKEGTVKAMDGGELYLGERAKKTTDDAKESSKKRHWVIGWGFKL